MKLFLFALLFVALCVTGGELCATGGPGFLEGLVGARDSHASPAQPAPLKPREEEFRGISPWPDLASRLPLPTKVKRN